MSGLLGLVLGRNTLLVGVEEREDGALKCYLGARWKGIYCIVDDPEDKAEVRRLWGMGQHVTFPIPDADELFTDADDEAAEQS